jgi:hypothetical protein
MSDVIEDIIVAAYKRGAEWTRINPDSAEYVGKAARDYADRIMSTEESVSSIVKAVNGFEKTTGLIRRLAAMMACDSDEDADYCATQMEIEDPSEFIAVWRELNIILAARSSFGEARVSEAQGER